jgi:integrase
MIRSKRLDDAGVEKLKPGPKRVTLADPELRGHYIRVTPNGAKSFWVVARDPSGKQHWKLIGSPPMKIADARQKAIATLQAIRCSAPTPADDASFEGVAGQWFQRHVLKNNHISERQTSRWLKKHIVPAFAGMNFVDVRRKDVTALLDRVEDECGARSADCVLSIVRGIANWYALRDDNYASPIVVGMNRVPKGKGSRDRILKNDEIAALWKADGLFGAFTKFALLTAQRKDKLMTMRWSDIGVGGIWHIPQEERQKGTADALRLPKMALDVLEEQRRVNADSPFVFAKKFGSPVGLIARQKEKFEAVNPMPRWTIHDLRRTARSLMAAAGVLPGHAEAVMGHKQDGVIGIYDRHHYFDEKADALARLAQRVVDIVTPPPINVTKIRRVP